MNIYLSVVTCFSICPLTADLRIRVQGCYINGFFHIIFIPLKELGERLSLPHLPPAPCLPGNSRMEHIDLGQGLGFGLMLKKQK